MGASTAGPGPTPCMASIRKGKKKDTTPQPQDTQAQGQGTQSLGEELPLAAPFLCRPAVAKGPLWALAAALGRWPEQSIRGTSS